MLQAQDLLKYLLEGLAVAVAAFYITGRKNSVQEVGMIGLTAALTFLVIDLFAPQIGGGLRQGSGFGIGYGMVGGGPTPRPWEWYNPDTQLLSRKPLREHFESQAQAQEVAKNLNKPYKLVDGQYAAKVLLPGYNENVAAYNARGCKFESHPHPWNQETPKLDLAHRLEEGAQSGGADPAQTTEQKKNDPQQTQQQPAQPVTKNDNPLHRQAGALYSGDLITLTNNENVFQRGTVDSQCVFDKALPRVTTNLSNLRFEHASKHKNNAQTVINYGDPVHLKHSVYYNNKNENRYVKFGERLQSHQEGPLFRTYKIFDPNDLELTSPGPVEPGKEVVLCRGDAQGKDIYLTVESDKSISSKNTVEKASKFKIDLDRVYELHNKSLCVCPGELLYP